MRTMRLMISVLCMVLGLAWMAVPAVASCEWSALGSGMNQLVIALTVFDEGTGPALYAGGTFDRAGGVPANRIAKWDGAQWSPLGSGMDNWVEALTVFDEGTGPALYAGGDFGTAGGVRVNRIAKWDGKQWSAFGGGINDLYASVLALTVFDDGTGPALYAGGAFETVGGGGVPANFIAKWNGTQWSALGSGMNNQVYALTVFDDGMGPALYAGGQFFNAGGVPVNHIAKWDGTQWSPLGSGMSGMNDRVRALTVFDDGMGPALYAGGYFTTAGGVVVNGIAKWDGTQWSALGSGMNVNDVEALTVFDDGTGRALYAGGPFDYAGGVPVNRIAKWDGTGWYALGSGVSGGGGPQALTVFDDGTGGALYAGGHFTSMGGVTVNHIAKWGCAP